MQTRKRVRLVASERMAATDARTLVGRAAELAQLHALIDAVRAGKGGTLVVAGLPGVGKSALLTAARPDDLRVLAVTGVQSEIDLPFAALTELLAPVTAGIDALPDVQRRALSAALSLGDAQDVDRSAVLHATAELIKRLAAEEPLLLYIDDVQWLDPSSREVVGFIARRARRLGAGVLVARSLRGDPLDGWPVLPTLTLDELARGDALELALATGVAPAVAEALVDALGGNPLALSQAPAEMTAAQRAGRAALPARLSAGERLHVAYGARVARLPEATRHALLLAGASSDGASVPLAAALGGMAAFGPAEEDGLVTIDPQRVRFSHPVIRTAVYHGASPSARRDAHRELAAVLSEPERAWQLALAAELPDEELAARLEHHAGDAASRGAPGTASRVLERAAALSPDSADATSRTLAAAAMALVAGRPHAALSLVDSVSSALDDPLRHADAQILRGMAVQQTGRPMEAYALLTEEAERVVAHDPARAAGLLTQAGVALVAHGPMDRLAALAERALELAPPGGALVPAVFHASALASLGDHRRARSVLRERSAELRALDPTGPGHEILAVAALCLMWLEEFDEAQLMLGSIIQTARERGAVAPLVFPLSVLASVHLRDGDWAAARALSEEALALGEEAVGGFLQSVALTTAAFVAANHGDATACHAHAAEARAIGIRLGLVSTLACAEQALGFLALGEGRTDAAVQHLERALEHLHEFGSRDPAFLFTQADLAEAYVRAGRPEDARPLVDELADAGRATGGAWAAAAAARCAALVGDDDELDAWREAALAAHARVALPFERARTQLCLGERLRRARRRVDARAELESAHATFTALGARPWVRRAEQELAAAGAGITQDHELTAREREVCALVAGGSTNAEAAAALFVSPRTVEHHLRMAYRKLGVRSRSELARHYPRM
jgi:DNA-binding CsgD family transcriptional regulator